MIANYVLVTVLDARDVVVTKTDVIPALLGERDNKLIETNIYLHTVGRAKKEMTVLAEKTPNGTDCRE